MRMFEKDKNGHTYIRKHEYVHNSMNFLNAYYKMLDPKLDSILKDVELFVEYRKLIRTFFEELNKDGSVKK